MRPRRPLSTYRVAVRPERTDAVRSALRELGATVLQEGPAGDRAEVLALLREKPESPGTRALIQTLEGKPPPDHFFLVESADADALKLFLRLARATGTHRETSVEAWSAP